MQRQTYEFASTFYVTMLLILQNYLFVTEEAIFNTLLPGGIFLHVGVMSVNIMTQTHRGLNLLQLKRNVLVW